MSSPGNGEKPVHAYWPGLAGATGRSDDCSRGSPPRRGALFRTNQQLSVATGPAGVVPFLAFSVLDKIAFRLPNYPPVVKYYPFNVPTVITSSFRPYKGGAKAGPPV